MKSKINSIRDSCVCWPLFYHTYIRRLTLYVAVVVVVTFSSRARIMGEGLMTRSLPAPLFFSFKWRSARLHQFHSSRPGISPQWLSELRQRTLSSLFVVSLCVIVELICLTHKSIVPNQAILPNFVSIPYYLPLVGLYMVI